MPSSQTPIDICNQAMSFLGANQITSFNDASKEAIHCKANYDALRDAVLEEAEWSFALRRKKVSAPTADPDGVYLPFKAYKVDTKMLRVLQVASTSDFNTANSIEWYIENNLVLVNLDVVYVRYIVREEDTAKFSPTFVQALAARIARDLCLPITESSRKLGALEALYLQKLGSAQNLDGMQGKGRRIRSTWMRNSRRSGIVAG